MAGLGDATGWGRGEKCVAHPFPPRYDGLWRLRQVAKYRRKTPDEYPLGECEREGCGRKYRQTRAWQRFCSRRCRVMEWRENHPQIKLEDLLGWLEEKGLKLPSKST